MKHKSFDLLLILVLTLVSATSALGASCKTNSGSAVTPTVPQITTFQAIVPFIPPSYYACVEANVDELLKNYFTHYGNLYLAEQAYNGKVFLFRNIRVMTSMLVDNNTLNYSSAEFVALQPGAVGNLKDGELIDIVGINSGPLPEAGGIPITELFGADGTPARAIIDGWLLFTDCIFLPAGSVQLPAPSAPGFSPLY